MNRDYKNVGTARNTAQSGNPMGVGILIGLLLGLCIALGVALYINKGVNPFAQKQKQPDTPAPGREPAKSATPAEKPGKPGETAATQTKPRFDFYKILPGTEEAVTDKEFRRAAPASVKEVYYLQVAAFQNPSDADNMKARLALAVQYPCSGHLRVAVAHGMCILQSGAEMADEGSWARQDKAVSPSVRQQRQQGGERHVEASTAIHVD